MGHARQRWWKSKSKCLLKFSFLELVVFQILWPRHLMTQTLHDLMECDYRLSPNLSPSRIAVNPKPILTRSLSPFAGCCDQSHPSKNIITVWHGTQHHHCLHGTHQSDKSDGPSLMALFSVWISCFFPCSRCNNNVLTPKPGKKGSFRSFVQTSFCLVHLKGDSALKTQV